MTAAPTYSSAERRHHQQSGMPSVSTKSSYTEEIEERERIVAALSEHAYHLPGNTSWTQDLWQYLTNNHPVIGICCHHKYHFLQAGPRVAALIGSVCFGLIITNVVYLIFVFTDSDSVYVEWKTDATRTGWQPDLDDNVSVLSVSNVNLVLWTVGAFVHGLFDTAVWSLAACTCLKVRQEQASSLRRKRSMGVFIVVELVIFVTAIATLTVALRAAIDQGGDGDEGRGGDYVDAITGDGFSNTGAVTRPPSRTNITKVQDILYIEVPKNASDYEFLVAYMIELGLSYFLYYPVIGIVLFSGILTCGKVPGLGGRPYELQKERSKSSLSTQSVTTRRCSQTSRLFDIEEGTPKKKLPKDLSGTSTKKIPDGKTEAAKPASGSKSHLMKEGKVAAGAKAGMKPPQTKEGKNNQSSGKTFSLQSSSTLKADAKQPFSAGEKKKKNSPNIVATSLPKKDGNDKLRASVQNSPSRVVTTPKKPILLPNKKDGNDQRRASVPKKATPPPSKETAESLFYAASRECPDAP